MKVANKAEETEAKMETTKPSKKRLESRRSDRKITETTKQRKWKHENKTKQIWKLATWNVRSINWKENELIYEFNKEKLSILAIKETKKKGKGEKVMEDGHLLIYSGVPHE